jgi:hypothetical protein
MQAQGKCVSLFHQSFFSLYPAASNSYKKRYASLRKPKRSSRCRKSSVSVHVPMVFQRSSFVRRYRKPSFSSWQVVTKAQYCGKQGGEHETKRDRHF